MLKKRNAQGISIRVIIIAVIALVVLIVLIAIFNGRLGEFGQGIESFGNPLETCEKQEGDLVEVENLLEGECPAGEVQITSSDSIAKGNKCCITISSTTKSNGGSSCEKAGTCAGDCLIYDNECNIIESDGCCLDLA